MQDRLPRELRNLVYEHILDDRTGFLDGNVAQESPHGLELFHHSSKDPRYRIPRDTVQPTAHITNVKYMKKATLKELAEVYYRVTTFVLDGDIIPRITRSSTSRTRGSCNARFSNVSRRSSYAQRATVFLMTLFFCLCNMT
jgi:hypothetical protein